MPLKMVNVTGEALVTWLTSREWGVAACYQCLNLDMSVSQPSGMPSFAILNACQNSLWATESLTSLSENKFRDRLWSFLLEQKKLSQIIPSMARISKSWKMHNSETIIRRHPYWTSAKVSWFSDVLLLCLHFTQPITAVRRVRKISIFFSTPVPSLWRSFMDGRLKMISSSDHEAQKDEYRTYTVMPKKSTGCVHES